MRLEGSISLVTGGAKGLGLAIANSLKRHGAKVIVADLDNEALVQLPKDIDGCVLDVTCLEDARATAKKVVEAYGRIDILVNNAGIISSDPFVNIMNPSGLMHDYYKYRKSIVANMDSVFIMTSAVVEQMVLKRTQGLIINLSSISACGNEGQTAYSAAKAGVNAMTVTWAKELGRFGIRCNAIAPGFIDTPSTRKALNESIIKHIQSNTPLRRLGRAEEVAEAVISIINNDFMNGAILKVDGGLTI